MGLKTEDLKMNKTSPCTQDIYVPPTFYCTVSALCFFTISVSYQTVHFLLKSTFVSLNILSLGIFLCRVNLGFKQMINIFLFTKLSLTALHVVL